MGYCSSLAGASPTVFNCSAFGHNAIIASARVAVNAVLAGSLNLSALGLLLRSLERGTLSACVPLLALTPARMFVLGPFLLGETPTVSIVAAACFMIGGTLLLLESGSVPGSLGIAWTYLKNMFT